LEEDGAGSVGARQDSGGHEQGDGREADAAAAPGEESGEEERRADDDQVATHHAPPARDAPNASRSSARPATTRSSPAWRTVSGSGVISGPGPRRIATIVVPVRCRTASSAIDRPTAGAPWGSSNQSNTSPPRTSPTRSATSVGSR